VIISVVVVLLGAVLLAAALGGLALVRRPSERAVTSHHGVTALRVRLGGGRLEIAEDDRATARLEVVSQRRLGAAAPAVSLAAGLLDVDARGASARVSVRLPRGTKVRAEVRAGEIALWGSAGDLELVTGTGAVTGRELSGRRVAVRSAAGDVVLHFDAPPVDATASSGSGGVRLVLPDVAYDVQVESADPGGGRIEVTADPAAPRRLVARARGGSVSILTAAEPARL
jgi:hypothetical protein